MNTILTDDEIVAIKRSTKILDTNPWAESRAFARAIEAAVLAKLREQEPVACLVRYRSLQTRAGIAADGLNHYSEWSAWVPHSVEYGRAVTDPSRNHEGAESIWEMQLLVPYAAPLPAVVQVPQGWKLVPVEPTPEMLMAAQEADMDHQDHEEWLEFEGDDVKRIHRAMLNAAPSPESAAQDNRPKKLKVTLQDTEADRYKRMFEAACSALGEIAEALGIDPEDGGAEPILDAIEELKAAAPEAPAQGDHIDWKLMREARDALAEWANTGTINGFDVEGLIASMSLALELHGNPSQAIPAPWREAVKVAREALKTYDGSRAIDQWDEHIMPSKEWDMRRWAALAQLDALEGGE